MVYTRKGLFLKVFCVMLAFGLLGPCAHAADTEEPYEDSAFPWESMVLPQRDLLYYPDEAVKLMGLKSGDMVADVGPGPGYWTFRLAREVGPLGRVYAIDIDTDYYPDLNSYFAERVADKGQNPYGNIRIMRSLEDDIGMPPDTLDAVFLCQMGILLADVEDAGSEHFGIYSTKAAMMRISRRLVESIYRALKPGGKLIVIDMFDSEVIRTNEFYTRVLRELRPFIAAKDVALARKNFEDMGFKLKEEYDIYSSEKHATDVEKFRKLPVYRDMPEKVKMFYINEMFFLVLEKPQEEGVGPGIIISSDKDTYSVGDTIKIKADYKNLPENSERFWLKDSPYETGLGGIKGRAFEVSVVPKVTHKGGAVVREISIVEDAHAGRKKRFSMEPDADQVELKIQKQPWEDKDTGMVVYDGAGFTSATGPSEFTLYCLDKVPGEYTVTLTRKMSVSVDGGEPMVRTVDSNPITLKILPSKR